MLLAAPLTPHLALASSPLVGLCILCRQGLPYAPYAATMNLPLVLPLSLDAGINFDYHALCTRVDTS